MFINAVNKTVPTFKRISRPHSAFSSACFACLDTDLMVVIFVVSSTAFNLCSVKASTSCLFSSVFTILDRRKASFAAFSAARMHPRFTSACTALPTWSATVMNFALPAEVVSPRMNVHESILLSPFMSVLSVA